MGKIEDQLHELATPFLEDDEELLAGVVARPKGSRGAPGASGASPVAATISREIMRRKGRQSRAGAEGAEFRISNPVGLVLTSRRLISFDASIGGSVRANLELNGLLDSIPVSEVDSIKTTFLRGLELTVRGATFKMDVGPAGDVKRMAAALERAKARA